MGIALHPVARTFTVREAWSLPNLSGRLVEISAGAEAAHLTAAFGLVLEAQLTGDRAVWVTLADSTFFPPDVAEGGLDLDALAVVRVRDVRLAGRAADHLARSGGFGLIVIDLSGPPKGGPHERTSSPTFVGAGFSRPGTLPVPLLTRLLGLAREHDAVILILTTKSQDMPSVHSLISLRVEARWRHDGARYDLSAEAVRPAGGPPSQHWLVGSHSDPTSAKVELCIRALKDKRRGPGWTHVEICRGPAGLR